MTTRLSTNSDEHIFYIVGRGDLLLKGIIFGSNTLDQNSTTTVAAGVDRAVIHPDYNPGTIANDIAVLQLSEPVFWTDFVRPVCLQMDDNEMESYSTCYVAGWGQMWPPNVKICEYTDNGICTIGLNILHYSSP